MASRSQGAALFWKEGESSAAEGVSPLRTKELPRVLWPGGCWYFDQAPWGKERGLEPNRFRLRNEWEGKAIGS